MKDVYEKFVIVGFVETKEEVYEIEGIVKLAKVGFRIQDMSKGV